MESMFSPGFFLTSVAQNQAQNSTSGRHRTFLLIRETQEKNSISPIFLLILKKFKGIKLFMPFWLTNISNFYQFETFFLQKNITFWKIDNKSFKERLKTQEKTRNSRKKLRVWEALAPYVFPSCV